MLTGKVLQNRYVIGAYLSKGGSSEIYLVQDRQSGLSRHYAVKCVKKSGNEEQISQFRREMNLLDRLSHPNMSNIRDFIEEEDCFYIVMDFVNGCTVKEKIREEGSMSGKDVIALAKTLCDVFSYLHEAGDKPIVFCDVNPSNIMLDEHGIPRLIDFGIAQEGDDTKPSDLPPLGTPGFAAPEQYKKGSRIITPKTDVFGLGATLFYMLTGRKFSESKDRDVREFSPDLSPGLASIIRKAIQDDPDKRYSDMKEFSKAIEELEIYNEGYIKKLRKKAMLCSGLLITTVCLCIASLTVFGLLASQVKKASQQYLLSASSYKASGNIEAAETAYLEAISADPDDCEAYEGLYQLVYDQNDEANEEDALSQALDRMRYLTDSSVFRNSPEFLIRLIEDCVVLSDPVYQQYGRELIGQLQKTGAYKKGEVVQERFEAYDLILSYTLSGADEEAMRESARNLIAKAQENIEDEEKMNLYAAAVSIYALVPNEQSDQDTLDALSQAITTLEEKHAEDENFSFKRIILVYANLASAYSRQYQSMDEKDPALLEKAKELITRLDGAQLTDSKYLDYASMLTELGDYEGARSIFSRIVNQEDAAVQLGLLGLVTEEVSANGSSDYTEAVSLYQTLSVREDLTAAQIRKLNAFRIRIGL